MKQQIKQNNRLFLLLTAGMLAGLTAFPVSGAQILGNSAAASSELYEPGYDHSAWRAMDNDLSTAWMEGADGPGYGEYMTIYTDPWAVITGGVIYAGFYADEDLFYKNNAPTRLYIRAGNQEAYLDVTESATTYQQNFAGYHFTFDEPLVSDGSVRVTIVGVRQGWLYDDTCITELRFEGYQADASTAPQVSQSIPHVSVVQGENTYTYPGESQSAPSYQYPGGVPDFYYDVNGLGGDGREPEELDGTQDPDYLDPTTVQKLTRFASALYSLHSLGAAAELDLRDSELYSFSRAYMLNWYQSHYADDRIMISGGDHYGYADNLMAILRELFSTTSPADDLEALEVYFTDYRDDQLFRLRSNGDAWKSGPVYLDMPYSAQEESGRTHLAGQVMEYNEYMGTYTAVMQYHAWFIQDMGDPSVFRFDELITG